MTREGSRHSSQPAFFSRPQPTRAGQRVPLAARRCLTPQTTATPQLYSLIGVRMEIAEAAFRSPSHASRTVFLCALAPPSGGYRWLKL